VIFAYLFEIDFDYIPLCVDVFFLQNRRSLFLVLERPTDDLYLFVFFLLVSIMHMVKEAREEKNCFYYYFLLFVHLKFLNM
jgi:hypothetical protein